MLRNVVIEWFSLVGDGCFIVKYESMYALLQANIFPRSPSSQRWVVAKWGLGSTEEVVDRRPSRLVREILGGGGEPSLMRLCVISSVLHMLPSILQCERIYDVKRSEEGRHTPMSLLSIFLSSFFLEL